MSLSGFETRIFWCWKRRLHHCATATAHHSYSYSDYRSTIVLFSESYKCSFLWTLIMTLYLVRVMTRKLPRVQLYGRKFTVVLFMQLCLCQNGGLWYSSHDNKIWLTLIVLATQDMHNNGIFCLGAKLQNQFSVRKEALLFV